MASGKPPRSYSEGVWEAQEGLWINPDVTKWPKEGKSAL